MATDKNLIDVMHLCKELLSFLESSCRVVSRETLSDEFEQFYEITGELSSLTRKPKQSFINDYYAWAESVLHSAKVKLGEAEDDPEEELGPELIQTQNQPEDDPANLMESIQPQEDPVFEPGTSRRLVSFSDDVTIYRFNPQDEISGAPPQGFDLGEAEDEDLVFLTWFEDKFAYLDQPETPRWDDLGYKPGRRGLKLETISPFYRSAAGLCPDWWRHIPPLFIEPVEILALSKEYYFSGWHIISHPKSKFLFNFSVSQDLGLSNNQRLALAVEDLRRYVSNLQEVAMRNSDKETMKKIQLYHSNLRVLSFIRACWDAILLGYQSVRKVSNYMFTVNSKRRHHLNAIRRHLYTDPAKTAANIKLAAGLNRDWSFGANVFNDIPAWAKIPVRAWAMQFSYIARSLPPPPLDESKIPDLRARLTSDPKPEMHGWRDWVNSYIQRFQPQVYDLWTQATNHSALGYPRSVGGHAAAISDLVKLGFYLNEGRPEGLPYAQTYLISRLGETFHPGINDRTNVDLRAPWEVIYPKVTPLEHIYQGSHTYSQYAQAQLETGVEKTLDYLIDNGFLSPILPVYAEEKGLKVRVPTCTLTALSLVQQLFRRAIEQVMLNDPTASNGLGGPKDIDMQGLPGPWYSVDATAATDFHAQWLTQTVYEEISILVPELGKYRKYFQLMFGPKYLLPDDMRPELKTFGSLSAPYPEHELPRFPSMLDQGQFYWNNWSTWLTKVCTYPGGVITSTGQMMGDPSSFPSLTLLSKFCTYKAFKEVPLGLIPGEAKTIVYYVTHGDKPARRRIFSASSPVGDEPGKYVGDDALIPLMHRSRKEVWDRTFDSSGGKRSEQKSYLHPEDGIYAETRYRFGSPIPHMTLSVWVAPPGGSKGHISWHNQAAVAVDMARQRGVSKVKYGLWNQSPFYHFWSAAQKLGIPVGAEIGHGGLNHPTRQGRVQCSDHEHFMWLATLTSMTLGELLTGTGLAVAKTTRPYFADLVRDEVNRLMVEHNKLAERNANLKPTPIVRVPIKTRVPGKPPSQWPITGYRESGGEMQQPVPLPLGYNREKAIPVKDLALRLAAPMVSIELYLHPQDLDIKVPSIRTHAAKIRRVIRQKTRGIQVVFKGNYRGAKQDIRRKLDKYLQFPRAWLPPSEGVTRSYGLATSPARIHTAFTDLFSKENRVPLQASGQLLIR